MKSTQLKKQDPAIAKAIIDVLEEYIHEQEDL